MPHKGLEVDSNQACLNNRGVYDGWIYYFSPSGHPVPPARTDLGLRLPKDAAAPALIGWTLDHSDVQRAYEQKPRIDRARVAAVSVTRLCISTEHAGPPRPRPYVSRRRELVHNIFIAREGAEVTSVHTSQTDFSDEHGLGTVRLIDGPVIRAEHAIFLPAYQSRLAPQPVTGSIELNVPGRRHRPVYGILRGLEEFVPPHAVQ